MLDGTDLEILKHLRRDARMQWKEIGEMVHLTGQAVAARIRKMEELGVIEAFTVQLNKARLGLSVLALVTVFMKTTDHPAFARWLAGQESVEEAHRVSGEGCYWLKVRVREQEELTDFLDALLAWGNYRVNLSLARVR
jgi:Lrp/AsnC family transcriptional regulator, leucine-responsive regulatory protein